MNNIFLTGEVCIGKTTLLNKVLNLLKIKLNKDLSLGGFYYFRTVNKENSKVTKKFYIVSRINGQRYKILEDVFIDNVNNVTTYKENFNTYSKELLENFNSCDLIALDEIGFAEANASDFVSNLNYILDSNKIVFGIIKKYDCDFLDIIKSRDDVLIIDVTTKNRNQLEDNICQLIFNMF